MQMCPREMSSCLYTSGNAYYENNGTLVYTLERTPRGGYDAVIGGALLGVL